MQMLTLDEVKEYLRLDTDCEDGYLNILILLACEMCENYTRIPIPDKLPESYKQAMLVCIGYFFEKRDGSKDGIPKVFYSLLAPYRRAVF
nr:MAG TPA: Head Tail Connector Protein [Caudoviricetes sp.]